MITAEPISTATRGFDDANGAALTFFGVVRSRSDERRVRHIDYEAYEPMAERVIADVVAGARGRFAIAGAEVIHRIGVVPAGEASLRVDVRAPHRDAAIAAMAWIVTTIKERVPIWKREVYDDDTSRWL